MEKVDEFISENLKKGDVPRVQDVWEFVKKNKLPVKKNTLLDAIYLNPIYSENVHKERDKKRFGKQRPIVSNTLGFLHADIGYYPVVREYTTPPSFQNGFFVAKDILSKYIYVELMREGKTTKNLIRVVGKLLLDHGKVHPDYKIKSISFDMEKGMIASKMQAFLKSKGIQFFYFQKSVTKASVAENGIKILRTEVDRLRKYYLKAHQKNYKWWDLLSEAAKSLNTKKIIVSGKEMTYRPIDITPKNVNKFINQVQKAEPGIYFSQFNYPRGIVKFKFQVGNIVRPKLISTSTKVIGVKTSSLNLDPERFQILNQIPFVSTHNKSNQLYKVISLDTGNIRTFMEEQIALSA